MIQAVIFEPTFVRIHPSDFVKKWSIRRIERDVEMTLNITCSQR